MAEVLPPGGFKVCNRLGCTTVVPVERRWCRFCRAEYARQNRPRYWEMTPEQRFKSNSRRLANIAQQRGQLMPQPCEVCGDIDVQKHHDDYAKPLEVRWFCKEHHEAHHRFGA